MTEGGGSWAAVHYQQYSAAALSALWCGLCCFACFAYVGGSALALGKIGYCRFCRRWQLQPTCISNVRTRMASSLQLVQCLAVGVCQLLAALLHTYQGVFSGYCLAACAGGYHCCAGVSRHTGLWHCMPRVLNVLIAVSRVGVQTLVRRFDLRRYSAGVAIRASCMPHSGCCRMSQWPARILCALPCMLYFAIAP